MNIISTLNVDDLNNLLQNPSEWLDIMDDDCLLVTIAHHDCTYYIFAGCDVDGYYLYIEDEDHCEYRYDKEDGKTFAEIYEDLFEIAHQKQAF